MPKVQLGSYTVENAKLKYGWYFFHSKCSDKVLLGFYSNENSKIRYRWVFNLFKILK